MSTPDKNRGPQAGDEKPRRPGYNPELGKVQFGLEKTVPLKPREEGRKPEISTAAGNTRKKAAEATTPHPTTEPPANTFEIPTTPEFQLPETQSEFKLDVPEGSIPVSLPKRGMRLVDTDGKPIPEDAIVGMWNRETDETTYLQDRDIDGSGRDLSLGSSSHREPPPPPARGTPPRRGT